MFDCESASRVMGNLMFDGKQGRLCLPMAALIGRFLFVGFIQTKRRAFQIRERLEARIHAQHNIGIFVSQEERKFAVSWTCSRMFCDYYYALSLGFKVDAWRRVLKTLVPAAGHSSKATKIENSCSKKRLAGGQQMEMFFLARTTEGQPSVRIIF